MHKNLGKAQRAASVALGSWSLLGLRLSVT